MTRTNTLPVLAPPVPTRRLVSLRRLESRARRSHGLSGERSRVVSFTNTLWVRFFPATYEEMVGNPTLIPS